MCYAAGLCVLAYDEYAHPRIAVAYLAVLVVWTLATWNRVLSAARCTLPFLAAELTLALTGVVLTRYVETAERIEGGASTLPTIWTAGAVLGCAIKGGWRWGAWASVAVGVANLVQRGSWSRDTVHNVLLVCVASIAIGYVIEVARASERTLARALQIEAATRERERLARDIHDSVLQVLAMVQRRGTALGGEAAELGRLAGEQEVALRTLVSSGPVPAPRAPDGGTGSRRDARRRRRSGRAGRAEPSAAATAPARTGGRGAAGEGAADGTGRPHPGRTTGGGRTDTAPGAGEEGDGARLTDLRTLLGGHAGSRVTFAEPGAPVLLPAAAARETAAAVGAALDNVRRHAGEDAHAWILLEDEPDAVLVTVRDDGPGIPEGRLAAAEAEGRMGVALSIRGRLRELGGTAALVSVPGQGTEVELRVPKDGGAPQDGPRDGGVSDD
ncbi:sensor histidine kinase [Streptomyces sp. JJ36]|nr:sensor histidine kinase [Streptomyces sp. JJ36]